MVYGRIQMRAPFFPATTNTLHTHPFYLSSVLILLSHLSPDLKVISYLNIFRPNLYMHFLPHAKYMSYECHCFWCCKLIRFAEQDS
jgi:hypothetical protein